MFRFLLHRLDLRPRRFRSSVADLSKLELIGEPSPTGFWVSRTEELRYRSTIQDQIENKNTVLCAHISMPSIEGSFWNDSATGWDCHQIGYVVLEFEGSELHHEKDFFTHLSYVFLNACLSFARDAKPPLKKDTLGRSAGEMRREAGRKTSRKLDATFPGLRQLWFV